MAVDYFLKISGIDGESKDAKHTNQIDVISFSWSETQPGSFAHGSGGTGGKVAMADLNFTMVTNKATTQLMAACASGKHFENAILYCRKATGDGGQQEYMTWTMAPIIISGYRTGGSSGAEVPIDSVDINYGKIKVEYKMQVDDKGTLQNTTPFGWDLEKNEKF